MKYHCMVHQQKLGTKWFKIGNIMKIFMRNVKFDDLEMGEGVRIYICANMSG